MIDGITIQYSIDNFEIWREQVQIQFYNATNIDTGEIRTKKRKDQIVTTFNGKWETFELEVKEVSNIETRCKRYYFRLIYYMYYKPEDEEKHGIVAFELKVISKY